MADSNATKRAAKLTAGKGEHSFATWLKIAEDDTSSPSIRRTPTSARGRTPGLRRCWPKSWMRRGIRSSWYRLRLSLPLPIPGLGTRISGRNERAASHHQWHPPILHCRFIARSMNLQINWRLIGCLRYTGQVTFQKVGAATRLALIETAAKRLGVPYSRTHHAGQPCHSMPNRASHCVMGNWLPKRQRLSLDNDPKLKSPDQYRLMRQSMPAARYSGQGRRHRAIWHGLHGPRHARCHDHGCPGTRRQANLCRRSASNGGEGRRESH